MAHPLPSFGVDRLLASHIMSFQSLTFNEQQLVARASIFLQAMGAEVVCLDGELTYRQHKSSIVRIMEASVRYSLVSNHHMQGIRSI